MKKERKQGSKEGRKGELTAPASHQFQGGTLPLSEERRKLYMKEGGKDGRKEGRKKGRREGEKEGREGGWREGGKEGKEGTVTMRKERRPSSSTGRR